MSDKDPVDMAERAAVFARMREDLRVRDELAESPDPSPEPAPAAKADPQIAAASPGGADANEAAPLAASFTARPPVVRIALAWPVTIDGVRLRQVALWPPETQAVEDVVSGRMSRAAMIAKMAGQPDGFLSRLRFPDAELVTAIALVLAPEFGGVA